MIALLSACASSNTKSQQHLRTAVDAQHETLNRCYAKSLARDPDTSGTMTVVMHVPTSGKVDKVTIQSGELASKKLQTCVRNALVGMTIAKPDGEMNVQYTLRFAPAVSAEDTTVSRRDEK